MPPKLRLHLSRCLQSLARLLGTKIRDIYTGEVLGHGFLVPWRGRLHLVAYKGIALIPVFQKQENLTYSRQTMGFTHHPEVDFERQPK